MKRREIIDGKTRCPNCKETKRLEEFSANASRWDGIQTQCKVCREERRKRDYAKKVETKEGRDNLSAKRLQWQRENREKVRGYCHKFYNDNREYNIQRSAKWVERNRDRYNARIRKDRIANPEKYRAWGKASHIRNKEYYKLSQRIRKSRVKGAEGKCSTAEWKAIIKAQDNRCNICGRNDQSLTVDHIIPVSRGGSNWPQNIQGLCLGCNVRKYNRTMDEYMKYLMKSSGR